MKKKEMTVKELASLGGHARKKKLSAARRKEIAQKAIRARWDKSKGAKSTASRQGHRSRRKRKSSCERK